MDGLSVALRCFHKEVMKGVFVADKWLSFHRRLVMQSVRSLTVGYRSRRSSVCVQSIDRHGDVVRENGKSVYRSCTLLRISGNWLSEAGFKEGDKVRVEVSKGQLVIKLEGGTP